jgi:hypothetical protein
MDCEICGNPIDKAPGKCPFCGALFSAHEAQMRRGLSRKTINLERGKPTVDVAMKRLSEAIAAGKREGITLLTLIHGYGSSGTGGAIKAECHKTLGYLKSRGTIKEYIGGEDFTRRSGQTRSLLGRYPSLKTDENLNKANRGITQVILC